MAKGSFLNLRTGLLDPKHMRDLAGASPLGLYLYIHSLVRFSGEHAGSTHPNQPYCHIEAAAMLGCDVRSVKRFFAVLLAKGYVHARRANHGLHVSITKYRPALECSQEVPEKPSDNPVPLVPEPSDKYVLSESEPSDSRVIAKGLSCHSQVTAVSLPYIRTSAATESTESIQTLLTESLAATAAPKPVPKPNRNGAVIDAIRAEDVPVEMTARDHKAVKDSQLSPSQIADAYCALYRGEWGDEYLQTNLSVRLVIERWAGYQASVTQPAPQRRQQRVYAGTAAVAEAIRRRNANGTDFDPSRRGMGGSATLPRLSG